MKSVLERNSSPSPVFSDEELRAYHSVEKLIEEQSRNESSSPCIIIPPTPINEHNFASPPINYIENCHLPPDRDNSPESKTSLLSDILGNVSNDSIKTDNEDRESSLFIDSDADPEYFPSVDDKGMVDLLREDSPCCSKTLTRKRSKHPENWKQNIRKKKCQSGKEFTDNSGITRRKRQVKEGCGEKCPYGCCDTFELRERQNLLNSFWNLNAKSKGEFFGKMVYRTSVERKRTRNVNSRRKNTYHYHFLKSGQRIRVCQVFLTNTLDINKTRIHYYFDHLVDNNTTTSKSPAKGRHTKHKLSDKLLDDVVSHINGFTTIDSHYSRSSSNKKYLEPHLNLRKMYDLYCNDYDEPVKFWAYQNVFDTQFNLAFFVPKKDLCNKCEEHKRKLENNVIVTQDEQNEFSLHLQNKIRAKAEKDIDKTNSETNIRILVIDLQNVFALPKANVNCFYYKRKLLCFNLTAYCKDNQTTYCSIWNETTQGRGANELASAYVKILHAVVTDFPQTEKIIIWSDSCVAQNRNSILALCLLNFLKENQTVSIIEQKYSEPGHSLLQEVDAVHSTLERYLKNKEIYSPVGLIRLLANAKFPKVKLKIMQMSDTNFWNYSLAAQKFNFSCIPYTKVKHMKYESSNIKNISYKRSFDDNFTIESINKPVSSRRTRKNIESTPLEINFDVILCQKENSRLSEEKREGFDESCKIYA